MTALCLAGLFCTYQSAPVRPVIVSYRDAQQAANRLATTVFVISKPPAGYEIAAVESVKAVGNVQQGLPNRTVIHIRYLNRQTKHAFHFLQSPAGTKISVEEHAKRLLASTGFQIEGQPKAQRAAVRKGGFDFVVTAPIMSANALKTLLKNLSKVGPR